LGNKDAEIAWAQNYISFVPFAIGAWILIDTTKPPMTVDALIVMVVAVVRTVRDYQLSWSFYFQRPESTSLESSGPAPSQAAVTQS
jgi:hypothetical protein